MDVNDLKGLFAEVNKRMNAALDHVKHELAGVRTGRASTALLDHVHVDAYGTKMPMNQVATLSVPGAHLDRGAAFRSLAAGSGRARDSRLGPRA